MAPPSELTPALTISPFERPLEAPSRPDQAVGIGVVGYGYWGPNLVRNFGMTPGAKMVAVSDLSPSRLASVQALYPALKTTPVYENLLSDPEIETQHFVDCITQNATPLTDGKVGLRVVRILEAATESLKQGGCLVQLKGPNALPVAQRRWRPTSSARCRLNAPVPTQSVLRYRKDVV